MSHATGVPLRGAPAGRGHHLPLLPPGSATSRDHVGVVAGVLAGRRRRRSMVPDHAPLEVGRPWRMGGRGVGCSREGGGRAGLGRPARAFRVSRPGLPFFDVGCVPAHLPFLPSVMEGGGCGHPTSTTLTSCSFVSRVCHLCKPSLLQFLRSGGVIQPGDAPLRAPQSPEQSMARGGAPP